MKSLFITGTDTGVGKTIVAAAIAHRLREKGIDVGVMKPAETGCRIKGGVLVPADAAFLKRISGADDPIDDICPYRFREPLAPAVAADRQKSKINFGLIRKKFKTLSARHDVMLVEGAGGIMVPLGGKKTYLDLAAMLSLPVLIVGRAGLGTINHTLMTVNAVRSRGLEISGIILNNESTSASFKTSSAAAETNPAVIRELAGKTPVYTLSFMPGAGRDKDAIAALGAELAAQGFLA